VAQPSDERFGPEAERLEKDRKARIEREWAGLADHPWAGPYYHGDGLGVNVSLLLAPGSGFVFTWQGCLGLYDRNLGDVHEAGDGLTFAFRFPNVQHGFRGLAPQLVPVRWGPRRYLVAPRDLVKYCNAVNFGREPRAGAHGSFFLRQGDWDRKTEGRPLVPEEYRPYLLARPIEGTIRRVGPARLEEGRAGIRLSRTTVTLDVGRRHGVLPGMEFSVHEGHRTAEVLTVAEHEATAEIVDILTRPGAPEYRPTEGSKVTAPSRE
jgi:hypothetical protein